MAGFSATTDPRGGEPTLITPVERAPRASESVAAQIRRLIATGQLNDGDLLPPEGQLLARFGVSRPTLREALRILESEQLISVSRGSRTGARINTPRIDALARHAGLTLQTRGAPLADIYQAQEAIAPFAAGLLAQRADPATVEKLRAQLDVLNAQFELQAWRDYSASLAHFHLLVVELTGNQALTLVASLLAKILERHQTSFHPPARERTPGTLAPKTFRSRGVRSIRKLIDLIEAGEAGAAEAHWRQHLQNAGRFWLEGVDSSLPIDTLS